MLTPRISVKGVERTLTMKRSQYLGNVQPFDFNTLLPRLYGGAIDLSTSDISYQRIVKLASDGSYSIEEYGNPTSNINNTNTFSYNIAVYDYLGLISAILPNQNGSYAGGSSITPYFTVNDSRQGQSTYHFNNQDSVAGTAIIHGGIYAYNTNVAYGHTYISLTNPVDPAGAAVVAMRCDIAYSFAQISNGPVFTDINDWNAIFNNSYWYDADLSPTGGSNFSGYWPSLPYTATSIAFAYYKAAPRGPAYITTPYEVSFDDPLITLYRMVGANLNYIYYAGYRNSKQIVLEISFDGTTYNVINFTDDTPPIFGFMYDIGGNVYGTTQYLSGLYSMTLGLAIPDKPREIPRFALMPSCDKFCLPMYKGICYHG